jgi:hypothetical protein
MSRNVIGDRHQSHLSAQDQLRTRIRQLEARIKRSHEKLQFEDPYSFEQKKVRIELAYDETTLKDLRGLLDRAPVDEWRPASSQVFETLRVRPARREGLTKAEIEAAKREGISSVEYLRRINEADEPPAGGGVIVMLEDD